MPVDRALNSSTNWKYWVKRKVAPNRAKKTSVMPALAAVKRGFLKNDTSSIGWSVWLSQRAKSPRSPAPTTNPATIVGSVQPHPGASMMAKRSAVRPAIDRKAPRMSSFGAAGSFDDGMISAAHTTATTTMGTFTRKIEPQ